MYYIDSATQRIDAVPHPTFLFEFPSDAVREVIVGMRADPSLVAEVVRLAGEFPKASFHAASEHRNEYKLVIEPMR